MYVVGIVLFILGLLISVGLHELGHMYPAKKFGVKVSDFFIGFGPTLFSRVKSGTRYGLKAIPLGGFVRIAGMITPRIPGRKYREDSRKKDQKNAGNLTLAEQAREQSAQELGASEQGIFADKGLWMLHPARRIIVMAGGPLMNAVIALICVIFAVCMCGSLQAGTVIESVSPCVGHTSHCQEQDYSPARIAGIEAGDRILEWDGARVDSWAQFQSLVSADTNEHRMRIEREGRIKEFRVQPREVEGRALLGVSPRMQMHPASIGEAVSMYGKMTASTAGLLLHLPQAVWHRAENLLGISTPSNESVMGIVGVAQVAGSISSAHMTGYTWVLRAHDFFMMMASLNLTLFLFNLIPLLPLDGGHIASALWEWIKRLWARFTHVPVYPVDNARLLYVSYAVMYLLIVMTVILIAADFVAPVVGG